MRSACLAVGLVFVYYPTNTVFCFSLGGGT
jgi:hypothetical protein